MRSVVSFDEPVHCKVPVVVRLPMAMVPAAAVGTVPSPPATVTLPMDETLRVPLMMMVWPE